MSCGIYKITNLINQKSYIGQSINIESRWIKHRNSNDDFAIHKAMRKYGINNFTFTILEECNPDQLDDREIYWINFYNTLKTGYNMVPGGSNGSGFAKGKKVEQYTLTGEFVAKYNSAHEASRVTGIGYSHISKCCREEAIYAGLYQWKYADSEKVISPIDINSISIKREIYQYDLEGNLIATYNSLAEAHEKTGIDKPTICNVCKGKGKTAGGYRWTYFDIPSEKQKVKCGVKKRVGQYDKNNRLIKIFDSITQASSETNITLSNISEVCRGKRKTAGKYIWKFIDE